ncbi:MAG: acyltransferase domain-containing protein, partial [Phycicoccus sp.]
TSQADEFLGYSVAELCLRDPDKQLNRTEYTQPALYVVNVLHYLDRLADGPPPAVVAGHSLGEYCALFAAGAFDFCTGLALVRKRGELMSTAPDGAMAAVLDLEQERVVQVLDALALPDIEIANINSRTQCVLSGAADQVRDPGVATAFRDAGAKFVPLRVSAAFHSSFMTQAQGSFADFLAEVELGKLRIPVVANRTARFYPTTEYADLLVTQITGTVRWYESVSWLLHQGYRDIVEVGPGAVLTGLTQQIVDAPMSVAPPPRPLGPESTTRRRLVFAYAGYGSQYYGMGHRLGLEHPAFGDALRGCDRTFAEATGSSLVDVLHDSYRRAVPLDDLRIANAALFCVSHSLTAAVRADGFEPDAVLGHGVGEYAAATASGALTFQDGLQLVLAQADVLAGRCPGGLLGVLASPALVDERADLFAGLPVAAVNYADHFVVGGPSADLDRVRTALDADGVVAVRLPARHPFHTHLLGDVRNEMLRLGAAVPFRAPEVPIFSAAQGGEV